ncbi:MAG: hypothetical protein Q7L55_06165 [Actinomycetota bacterium]|nr:hypothetical protein [Actinomycetota bacterium]
MTEQDENPDVPGSFFDMRQQILSAINSRIVLLVGLATLKDPSSNVPERHRTAAENPEHIASLNAATVVQIFGHIEGFVEGAGTRLGPAIVAARAQQKEEFRKITKQANIEARARGVSEEGIKLLSNIGMKAFEALRPGTPRGRLDLTLDRPERWEDALRRIWLGAPPDRPLPKDLSQTLNELAQVRNVLLHRMVRIDRAGLAAVIEGPWTQEDELVHIDGEIYNRYIAALWTYAEEIQDRFLIVLNSPPRNPSLEDWRSRKPAGG